MNLFNGLYKRYIYISLNSNKKQVQSDLGLKNKSMTHLCDTRLVCRYKNYDVKKCDVNDFHTTSTGLYDFSYKFPETTVFTY